MPSLVYHHHSKVHGHRGFYTTLITIIMRVVIPTVAIIWLLFFMRSGETLSAKPISLRGSSGDQGSVGGVVTKTSTAQVRRKTIVPNHAVIVAGHAVVRLSQLATAEKSDGAWYLLPYQRDQGFPSIITSHITKGVEIAKGDDESLLIFSGGQTRRDVGPLSEAASYYYVAQERKWIATISNRVALEEYARDSYENLLFSLCRFKEFVGSYPTRVTVVGFDFKGQRFRDLHRRAIGFPATNFTYVGLRPQHSKFSHTRAAEGEQTALNNFRKDMYGCLNPDLYTKRSIRDPFKRTVPYELACPELKPLLEWRGPEQIEPDLLPWGRNNTSLIL